MTVSGHLASLAGGSYRSRAFKIAQYSVLLPGMMMAEAIGMEDKQEHRESHEDRESQKLVDRIEKQQVSQEAARAEETRRTLDDYARKVGS
jgi:hypothetical protein